MIGADIVLIHGAWAGPWVWDTVLEPLTLAGHRPHPITLPGVGDTRENTKVVALDELTEAVRVQIAGLAGPLVLVGHSGGGVIATQLAEDLYERVAGVVCIAGMMLPSGRSFGDICDELGLPSTVGIGDYLKTSPDCKTSTVPPEAAAALFFQRAEGAAAIAAARRLGPQQETARLIRPTWTASGYGRLPRLYIEALDDRTIPLAAQRHMQQLSPGADVISLDCDHAPQLSAPGALARAISDFSTGLCRKS